MFLSCPEHPLMGLGFFFLGRLQAGSHHCKLCSKISHICGNQRLVHLQWKRRALSKENFCCEHSISLPFAVRILGYTDLWSAPDQSLQVQIQVHLHVNRSYCKPARLLYETDMRCTIQFIKK